MEKFKTLMMAYEKIINKEVTLIFQVDGSGELVDFYDNSRVYFEFRNLEELELRLKLYQLYTEIDKELVKTFVE